MSNIKCPFCQQELKIAGEHTTIMSCFNGDCKGSGLYGEKALWQELIRTRKVLDVAKDTIRHADWFFDGDYNVDAKTMHSEIKSAKDKITALEQKDVK